MAEDRSMMDVMRGSRILAYSIGLITLAAGVVLLFWPDRSITVVAKIAGVLVLIVGISQVFEALTTHRKGSYWGLLALGGLLNVVFGGLLIFWPEPTLTVIVWIFGLDLVVTGIIGLIASRSVPKELGRSALLFRSGFSVLFGAMVMAWPDVTLSVIALLIGIQLVLLGLILLYSGFALSRAEKDMAKG